MKNRWLLALIGALVVAGLVSTAVELFDEEGPSYGGQSFNYWEELAARGDADALPALREGLKYRKWRVRSRAATDLSYLGPNAKPAVPDLVAALQHDHDADVRLASVDALTGIEVSAHTTGRGLGSREALLALRSALDDQDPRVRQSAVLALRYIKLRSRTVAMWTAMVGSASSPFGVGGLSALGSLAGSAKGLGQLLHSPDPPDNPGP